MDFMTKEVSRLPYLGHTQAGSRVDFRGDLGIGKRAGNLIGFAELAFDLHEKRLHGFVPLNVQVQAALLADWRRAFKRWNEC